MAVEEEEEEEVVVVGKGFNGWLTTHPAKSHNHSENAIIERAEMERVFCNWTNSAKSSSLSRFVLKRQDPKISRMGASPGSVKMTKPGAGANGRTGASARTTDPGLVPERQNRG